MATTSAAVLSLLTLANALDVARSFPGATVGRGYVHIPVARAPDTAVPADRLRRRSGEQVANLVNGQNTGYLINITLGTPGQATTVGLDTGSIELWVNPDCSNAPKPAANSTETDSTNGVDTPDNDASFCSKIGRYDHTKSSSVQNPNIASTTFNYADFTEANITYYEDTLGIAGITVQNQIFGVATSSNQTSLGILGIGPSAAGFNTTPEYPYSLMLSNMAKQGVIASRAFSLDLRDFDNTTGSLIFGGVDKSKFSGSLSAVNFVSQQVKFSNGQTQTQYSYWVKVNSIAFTPAGAKSSTKNYNIPNGNFIADLDTGTGDILLPKGMAADVCADVQGTVREGTCFVNCTARQQSGGLTFGFDGGKTIQASYENLIETFVDSGTTYCYLSVQDSTIVADPPSYILGAPFLRSTYAVFDWDNQNVHLAQAANCGNSDIVAITAGANGVPTGGNCSPAPRSMVVNAGLLVGALVLGTLMLM